MGLLVSLTVIDRACSPWRVMRGAGVAAALAVNMAWAASVASAVASPAAQVEAAAREALQARAEQAGWLEARFDVTVLDAALAKAPACTQPLKVVPADVRHATRMRFEVACEAPQVWQRDVVVRARITARVVVMAQDVPAGRVIQDDDVGLEARDVTVVPDAVSDPQAVAGLASRRTLRTGQVVSQRALLTPVLVQRGQSVAIEASNGGITVNVPGEAMDTGRAGETVRVRNVGSGKVIRARVIDAGKVAPENMPGSSPVQSRD
jgi:flagella basal body P-ring formation protein FlgA